MVVDNVSDLDGLSREEIGAAAEAAKARGLNGKWVIALQNTTIQPALTQLRNRALREKIYKALIARADGDSLRAKVLSRGRTTNPEVLFVQFYGGPPDIVPLLEHRGLK